MIYEIAWTESIGEDLTNLNEEEFDELEEKLHLVKKSPNSLTKRVKGWENNIRRIRFGDYRLLIYVSEKNSTIYAIAYLPRKNCYSKHTEQLMKKIVQKIRLFKK